MCFANGRCLLCIAFLVLFAALLILAVVHRVRAKKNVLALPSGERVRLSFCRKNAIFIKNHLTGPPFMIIYISLY